MIPYVSPAIRNRGVSWTFIIVGKSILTHVVVEKPAVVSRDECVSPRHEVDLQVTRPLDADLLQANDRPLRYLKGCVAKSGTRHARGYRWLLGAAAVTSTCPETSK